MLLTVLKQVQWNSSLFFFETFFLEEHVLKVKKSKITGENAFNGDIVEIEDNHEYSKDEKTWF